MPWDNLGVYDGMGQQGQEAQRQPAAVKEALSDDEEDGDHLEDDEGPEPGHGEAGEAPGDEIEDEAGPDKDRGQVVEEEVRGQSLAVPS